MKRGAREFESVLLPICAAIPLYLTESVSVASVVFFHVAMLAVGLTRSVKPHSKPKPWLSVAAALYLIFFAIDGLLLSQNLLRASTHLLFFIAVYQAIESGWAKNQMQRLVVTFLIFVTSIATATHLAVVGFIVLFGFLLFRELMKISRDETARIAGTEAPELPVSAAAAFFVVTSSIVAGFLFPVLPRIHSPFVHGITAALEGTSTGISDTINFSDNRKILPDPEVVARIWMSSEAIPFFTPLRLRGVIYDTYERGRWKAGGRRQRKPVTSDGGEFDIARRSGFHRSATIQQKVTKDQQLFLPVGTYRISGVNYLYEGPAHDEYQAPEIMRGSATFMVSMSRETLPLKPTAPPQMSGYPITPEVERLARSIVPPGASSTDAAARIEQYMSRNFRYVPDPSELGRPVALDEFLLHERRGHCEYFAAGMVVLMNALGYPARVAAGFYGGDLNPLTGYFVVRREDAHAWVEVWDGKTWQTYDPTPPSLRPGNSAEGLLKAYVSAAADSVNYVWDRYILTFGLADQVAIAAAAIESLHNFSISAVSTARSQVRHLFSWGMALALSILVLLIAAGFWLSRRRRSLFLKLCETLARAGIDVGPSDTAHDIVSRVAQERPDLVPYVRDLVAVYERERFSPFEIPREEKREARKTLVALHRRARA